MEEGKSSACISGDDCRGDDISGDDISGDDCSGDDTSTPSDASGDDTSEPYDVAPWYADAKFNGYWRHQSRVAAWLRRHCDMSHMTSGTGDLQGLASWCQSQAVYHTHMANQLQQQWCALNYHLPLPPPIVPVNTEPGRSRPSSRHRKRAKRRRRLSRRHHKSCSTGSTLELHVANVDPAGGDLDISAFSGECFEFEITDDVLQFLLQSAKHREERDAQKMSLMTGTDTDEYIELSAASAGRHKATELPPSERPGTRRTAELRELYGKGSAMIHGMETAMQLNFDRNCDKKQPKLWPALPLNIKFT